MRSFGAQRPSTGSGTNEPRRTQRDYEVDDLLNSAFDKDFDKDFDKLSHHSGTGQVTVSSILSFEFLEST